MKSRRLKFGRLVPIATVVWFVLIAIYVSTNWRVFEFSYKPAIQPGTRWNNVWLSGGRVAWSRFDPAAASTPPVHQPPSLRARSYAMPNGSWFWKPYFARQAAGWFVGVPLWIPAVPITVIGPIPMLFRAGHKARSWFRRRVPEGVCTSCGYSLHGLQSRTCPECGSPTQLSASVADQASEHTPQPPAR